MSIEPKTFFEIVRERGQSAVADEIGVDKSIVHRCFHMKQGVNDALLAACLQAWGEKFDLAGTLIEWGRRRVSDRLPSQASAEG